VFMQEKRPLFKASDPIQNYYDITRFFSPLFVKQLILLSELAIRNKLASTESFLIASPSLITSRVLLSN